MIRFAILAVGFGLLLAGCGTSSLPSLTSFTTVSATTQPATTGSAPAVDLTTPTDRAVNVGATVARAQKCGYYFDANTLKSQYLAAEAQIAPSPETMKKTETAYEYARIRVARKVAKSDNYCTKERVKTVKAQLNRYLAGDYRPPKQTKKRPKSEWGWLTADDPRKEVWNPYYENDITGKSKEKMRVPD
ncbi:MAG: hypothetical protein ACR2PG_01195 [Hyphomicrobiaceae bacterium]